MNFTHFVFPHFSRLTVRIEHFRLENRIPDAQLYHFPAGMVWNHEVESKHQKIDVFPEKTSFIAAPKKFNRLVQNTIENVLCFVLTP